MLKERNGRTFLVLSNEMLGDRQARVTVQEMHKTKKGDLVPVGHSTEGVGGYKYGKDFTPRVAFQCAFENAADQRNQGMTD